MPQSTLLKEIELNLLCFQHPRLHVLRVHEFGLKSVALADSLISCQWNRQIQAIHSLRHGEISELLLEHLVVRCKGETLLGHRVTREHRHDAGFPRAGLLRFARFGLSFGFRGGLLLLLSDSSLTLHSDDSSVFLLQSLLLPFEELSVSRQHLHR